MAGEGDFIALMRALAGTRAARGLADDVALLEGAGDLVLTTDTMVEGIHYLPDDPPETIGWKLAAVNLSDLAAKGAEPVGCLVNYGLSGDSDWDRAFARGLGEALAEYAMPLLGGDTVAMPAGSPRVLTLTAFGRAGGPVPSRAGARPGDQLYLTGPVGDAGAGLALLRAGRAEPAALVEAYRRPRPRIEIGRRIAPLAHASMDVSDGLLIDARRMALASGVRVALDHIPVSPEYAASQGSDAQARIAAASAGDDYQLLFALPPDVARTVGDGLIRVGDVTEGRATEGGGLTLVLDGMPQKLPARLGWEHGASHSGPAAATGAPEIRGLT